MADDVTKEITTMAEEEAAFQTVLMEASKLEKQEIKTEKQPEEVKTEEAVLKTTEPIETAKSTDSPLRTDEKLVLALGKILRKAERLANTDLQIVDAKDHLVKLKV